MTKIRSEIVVLLTLGALIASIVYALLDDSRSRQIADLLKAETQNAHNLITHDLKLRVNSAERTVAHWEQARIGRKQAFGPSARRLLDDMPGFLAIAYINTGGVIEAVLPPTFEHMAGQDFAGADPMRARLLESASRRGVTIISDSTVLWGDGGRGVFMLTPIFDGDEPAGALLTVLNFRLWLDNVYFGGGDPLLSDLEVEVIFGAERVFVTDGFAAAPGEGASVVGVTALGRALRLTAKPGAKLIAQTATILPEVVALLLGLTVVALVVMRASLATAHAASRQVAAANQELLMSNGNLSLQITQRKAAERTAQLASDAKSQFLRSMSHEIRTPMNGVLGLTALLKRTPLDDHQRRMVDTIATSGQSLLTVINDVLDFARFEAGEIQIVRTRFDLRACVSGVVGLLGAAPAARGVVTTIHYDVDMPDHIEGDQDRVRQVLNNIIGNALKFTKKGRVEITVQMQAEHVSIAVTDTGIGIPADKIECIFDEFRQVDGAENRAYGGTGLGLAITRRILRAMGGDIEVCSTLGRGSTFTATFPVNFPMKFPGAEPLAAGACPRGDIRPAAAVA